MLSERYRLGIQSRLMQSSDVYPITYEQVPFLCDSRDDMIEIQQRRIKELEAERDALQRRLQGIFATCEKHPDCGLTHALELEAENKVLREQLANSKTYPFSTILRY